MNIRSIMVIWASVDMNNVMFFTMTDGVRTDLYRAEFIWGKIKSYYMFYVSKHSYDTCGWHPSLQTSIRRLYCILDIIVVDGLTKLGATPSVAMYCPNYPEYISCNARRVRQQIQIYIKITHIYYTTYEIKFNYPYWHMIWQLWRP